MHLSPDEIKFLCILLGYISLFLIGRAFTGRMIAYTSIAFPLSFIALFSFFQFILQKGNYINITTFSKFYLLLTSVVPCAIFFVLVFANEQIKFEFDTTFIVFTYSYSVIMFLKILIYLVMGSFATNLFTYFVIFILGIFSYVRLRKYQFYKYMSHNDMVFRISSICIFFTFSVLGQLADFDSSYFLTHRPLILMCYGFAVLIAIININYNYELDKKDAQLNAFNKYMPIVDGLIRDIKERQHSYNNALQAISMLPVTYTDYASITHALQKYMIQYSIKNDYSELLKLNLKLVAGFLISKCEYAKQYQKEIVLNLNKLTISTLIPEYILIEAIGILIDNAIEAISANEKVFITLDEINQHFYIKVQNIGPTLTDEDRRRLFRHGFTTKKEKKSSHGLGLSRLQSLVKDYNGIITLSNEEENNITFVVFELEV